ncbi:hypothetical protein DV737_g2453, partial [Chaetothyriales sp. CBS 132003]
MSSQLKPIKLYGKGGPNPPKVAFILEELGLPYEIEDLPFSEVKGPAYTKINPNGRIPSIQDPNTDLTLWESGAIIEYLIETYDKEQRLSFAPGTADYFHAKQWLFFQTTGQGPYYGQAAWFKKFHSEQVPSAIERYVKEANRVTGVVEGWLAKHGPWLVGNKVSYADIAWVQYQRVAEMLFSKEEYDVDKYPHVKAWLEKLTAREPIKRVLEKIS